MLASNKGWESQADEVGIFVPHPVNASKALPQAPSKNLKLTPVDVEASVVYVVMQSIIKYVLLEFEFGVEPKLVLPGKTIFAGGTHLCIRVLTTRIAPPNAP